jgi:hypothetical protein
MINYYQPFLLPFLVGRRHRPPAHLRRLYYFSFEDALWELLPFLQVPPGTPVLLPDFHCMDVIGNIEAHGYPCHFYALDDHFQASAEDVQRRMAETGAGVLFLFHACGITNRLIHDDAFLKSLPPELILIEDAVHRLVNPETVVIKRPRHFVIDSLRKDSPLPGSFIYGLPGDLPGHPTRHLLSPYTLGAVVWYTLFRMALSLGALLNNGKLINYAHSVLLQKHDDIIGDSADSHRGLPLYPWVHQWINFDNLKRRKAEQVRRYRELLMPLETGHPDFYRVDIPETDDSKLHVYPLGYRGRRDKELIDALHRRGMIVWFKFPDAPWSRSRQVLFLPLGFHVSDQEIAALADALQALA